MLMRSSLIVVLLSLLIPACDSKSDSAATQTTEKEKSETGSQDSQAAASKEKTDAAPAAAIVIPKAPVGFVSGEELEYQKFLTLYTAHTKRTRGKNGPAKKVGKAVEERAQARIVDRLLRERMLELESKLLGVDYDPKEMAKTKEAQKMPPKERVEFLTWLGETEESIHARDIADLRERALVLHATTLTATKAEIDEAYEKAKPNLGSDQERFRASHVYIAVGPREGDEKIRKPKASIRKEATPEQLKKWEADAMARALEIRTQLVAPGADFNELAKELSEGPGAYRGGDMGVFDRRRMTKAYGDKVFEMKVGEISEPVSAGSEIYIIKLFDRHAPGTLSKDAIRDDLVRNIENKKYLDGRNALRELMAKKFSPENKLKKDKPKSKPKKAAPAAPEAPTP